MQESSDIPGGRTRRESRQARLLKSPSRKKYLTRAPSGCRGTQTLGARSFRDITAARSSRATHPFNVGHVVVQPARAVFVPRYECVVRVARNQEICWNEGKTSVAVVL